MNKHCTPISFGEVKDLALVKEENEETHEMEPKIKTGFRSKTAHLCMINNKELITLYDEIVKTNKEYEEEAYKLVYGNDINQLKTVINHTKANKEGE